MANNKLRARWSKKDNDLLFAFPSSKSDGHYLHNSVFNFAFLSEMQARGFDITTLKFEITRSKDAET